MKLSEVKSIVNKLETIGFQLPNGELVPSHFHVTEVGKIVKHFIDCGGTIRKEEVVNFQLWNANDYDHRLHPERLLQLIELSEKALAIEDLEVEVEYQAATIGKFGLDFNGKYFELTAKQTDCLAKENCGIPIEKQKVKMADLNNEPCCSPDGNCC
jgi:hypothetical protein